MKNKLPTWIVFCVVCLLAVGVLYGANNLTADRIAQQALAAEAAAPAGYNDGTYQVVKTTDFSTITMELTVEGGAVVGANIASEGATDLLTDDNRKAWADQIVSSQAVDAVSGVTISSEAVAQGLNELLAQASGAAGGAYSVQKTTDFSTIDMELTVENGAVTAAKITSEGENDLLTDDIRNTWAEQIVEKGAIDAVSGVTISSNAVSEGLAELLAQVQPGGAAGGAYSVDKTTDFSTIHMELSAADGKVTSAKITSEGENDLLTDDIRNTWAEQIVEKGAIDAVSGVTISSNAVSEGLAELLEQAQVTVGAADPAAEEAPVEAEAPAEEEAAPEAEPVEEAAAEPAMAAAAVLTDGTYKVEKTTDFSTINVEMTVENGAISAAKVSSEGANDLLNDDQRNGWADQIVEKQAVDAVSGVTISSNAVAEAVEELLEQASAGEAASEDAEPAEAEAEAAATAGYADGTYSVEKTTDFSTINVEMTVENGAVSAAKVSSEGENDLLNDDQRNGWADQIVEKQAVDAVSGVTISSNAVAEAVEELLKQAAA